MRNMSDTNAVNDGTRSVLASILVPEVAKAFQDWFEHVPDGVLIGGAALSYYVKPRCLLEIEVLCLGVSEIPERVDGFKRTNAHVFQHAETGVGVIVATPIYLGVTDELAIKVVKTCVQSDNVNIASVEGLVALKLVDHVSLQDLADVEALKKFKPGMKMSSWHLKAAQMTLFNSI